MKLTNLLEQKELTLGAFLEANGYDDQYYNNHGQLTVAHEGITSLEGFPSGVRAVDVNGNELTSLAGFKQQFSSGLSGSFMCAGNKLTSLEHGPTIVLGGFYCSNNKLTSLQGGPTEVYGDFSCELNELTSLEGAPYLIEGDINLKSNKLTSLHNIHKHIKQVKPHCVLLLGGNPIKSHMLGVLKIKDLGYVDLPGHGMANDRVTTMVNIINNHLRGARNLFDCQAELEDEGLEEFAQL